MTMILALAAAVTLASAAPIPAEDADLHCMAAYLFAAGSLDSEADVTAAEKAQVATLVTYYLGRLHARFPGQSAEQALRGLVGAPGFDGEMIQRDVLRCNAEVERWSSELASVGSNLGIADPGNQPGAN